MARPCSHTSPPSPSVHRHDAGGSHQRRAAPQQPRPGRRRRRELAAHSRHRRRQPQPEDELLRRGLRATPGARILPVRVFFFLPLLPAFSPASAAAWELLALGAAVPSLSPACLPGGAPHRWSLPRGVPLFPLVSGCIAGLDTRILLPLTFVQHSPVAPPCVQLSVPVVVFHCYLSAVASAATHCWAYLSLLLFFSRITLYCANAMVGIMRDSSGCSS